MDESELQWLVTNKMLEKASVRLPHGETTPKSEPLECVVFYDQFSAGLCIPYQDFVDEIL